MSFSTPEIFGNMSEIVENNVLNDIVEEENIDINEQTSSIDKIIDNNNITFYTLLSLACGKN